MILNNELIAHQKRARAHLNDAHTQPTLTERCERIIKRLNSQRERRSDGGTIQPLIDTQCQVEDFLLHKDEDR